MSLKIKGWRKIVKCAVWSVICILFLIFFIRVVTFENEYYSSKEGTERQVLEDESNDDEELVEVEPTENEVVEYKVAPERPRYLTIEKLGIRNARILAVGVNANGELGTPLNIFDVGWYDGSSLPGQGGTLIIDGHNGGPHVKGVFKNLPSLTMGDIITVERGDGVKFNYRVVDSNAISLDDSDNYMMTAARSPEDGKESVTLISCTGDWSSQRKTYLSRQFVRAVIAD